MSGAPRTAGQALVEQLVAEGVELVFGVPGESYVDALDAFYEIDRPRFVTCRHEGGAAIAAEAASKLLGRPQACMVSRGPGAMNSALGVHLASYDATPVLFLVGQVPRRQLGLGGFQELDVEATFGHLSKFTATVTEPERVPETVARALRSAVAGLPGPAVLALPEDVLACPAAAPTVPPAPLPRIEPSPGALEEVAELVASAERPLVIAGGAWSEAACGHLAELAERWEVPVLSSFRRQDVLDNDHPCYAGTLGTLTDPRLDERVSASDLVVVLGARLDAITTAGYRRPEAPQTTQRLVHVHPSPTELGRAYRPDLAITASAAAFAAAARHVPATPRRRQPGWLAGAHADYLSWSTPAPVEARPSPSRDEAVDLTAVMAQLQGLLPRDAIVTNGAGNYTGWLQRYLRYHAWGTQLAPAYGTMGYGVPAALAAALARPGRSVVAFAGDGCFLMTGQELATAAEQRAGFVTVVVDNGCLGTVRAHQEARHPGRLVGTTLESPDFAKLCEAYGGSGWTLTSAQGFAGSWREAADVAAKGRPALLRLMADPGRLSAAGEPRA
ncbi:MAG: thiamine pyrophosphate-binding protein [Actinomycetota bacterium]|nr:thiamine pyrophosphate-binding protein [Actinomycetota bacterium]